ncbi:Fungal specific transcription factor domain-containing protein [Cladophialophora immunda]|nr:Fungal specific transcription factor domain-containing protein [Cladophialophora immunda]
MRSRLRTQGNFENGDSCFNCLDRDLVCSRPFRSRQRKSSKPHQHRHESRSRTDWIRGVLEPFQPDDHSLNIISAPRADSPSQLEETMLGLRHSAPANLAGGVSSRLLEASRLGDQASAAPGRDNNIGVHQNPSQGNKSKFARNIPGQGQSGPLQLPGFPESSETTNAIHTPLFVSDQHSLSSLQSSEPSQSNTVQTDLDEAMQKSSIWSSKMSNYQYSGPTSFISICSTAGIQWVSERTKSSSFVNSANEFTAGITRLLKIDKRFPSTPIKEPDAATAFLYTRAYFNESIDADLAVVHRPWFEQRLNEFYSSGVKDEDASWYALRMAVFACGCQIELSKTESFREANETGWRYFENALSVYTNILFYQTSIVGVQALVVMSYYCSTISHACLEYMLCNDAVRLAVAQGLHRQPPPSLNLTQSEITQRQCIFWAAYCLEKQTVCLSGRHSMIDDSDVTVELPTVVSSGSTLNLNFSRSLILVTHLSSMVSKQLTGMQALRQGLDYLAIIVTKLDEKLDALKKSLEPILGFSTTAKAAPVTSNLTANQVLYLRYAILNVALSIHTTLTHPWARYLTAHQKPSAEAQVQIDKSFQIVAETCRSAIRLVRQIQFDLSTPVS